MGQASTAQLAILHWFWSKVSIGHGPNACWVWMRGQNGVGYGMFCPGQGRRVLAHRFAFEACVGPIGDGMTLDHLCRNRACVNPAHLEAVTRGENVLRGVGPSAKNARKTHCKRGHPLSGDNLGTPPSGGRKCKACGRLTMERFKRKNPTYFRDYAAASNRSGLE